MKRVIVFSLVLLLLIVPLVNVEAKNGPKQKNKEREKKIIIKSSSKQVAINLSLDSLQLVTKFIRLHVKNKTDEDKSLRLKWKDKFDNEQLQKAIKCVFQKHKNSGNGQGNIVSIEKTLVQIDSGETYNGWVKIEFVALDKWWEVNPGTHRAQLAVTVKSE